MRKKLDKDTMKDSLFEEIVMECKRKHADDEEIENTEHVKIKDIDIEFTVED